MIVIKTIIKGVEGCVKMKWKKCTGVGMSAIMVIGFISILPGSHKANLAVTLVKGKTTLQQISNKKVSTVEHKIQAMEQQEKQDREKKANVSYAVRFENTIIMGDSLSLAFTEYRLLNANEVVASRGNRIDEIDDDIRKVINLSPKVVFMGYGMNDLEYVRGNAQRFINMYKKQLEKLKKALPDTKIYINSIIPMNDKAKRRTPVYKKYTAFNTALQKMCKEEHVTYIDNTHLMNWNNAIYEPDGVHPLFPYYPKWLDHMAEVAGL